MIFLLFLQIEWQTINRPYSNTTQELVFYLSIPSDKFKYITEDSVFYTEYEIQLTVYDKKGNQVTGDFWETQKTKDTIDIKDSVKIIIPKESKYFDLKIVDRHAGEIFSLTEKIFLIKYIGNIKWDLSKEDILTLTFTIINPAGDIDSLFTTINDISNGTSVATGSYDDTLIFNVISLPNGHYALKFQMYSKTVKVDEVEAPIEIARPFYLDEVVWPIKVDQLEYIATPSEQKKLKRAKKIERDSLWRDFWKQHDPTPNTEYNEKEVEYFERIKYCEEHFSHGDQGWRSDRAKIYVKYGQPDEIQYRPYELYAPPKDPMNPITIFYDSYEIWHYYKMNRRFVFGDRYGLGQYILLNPGEVNQ